MSDLFWTGTLFYNQLWLSSFYTAFVTTLRRGRVIERSGSNSAPTFTAIVRFDHSYREWSVSSDISGSSGRMNTAWMLGQSKGICSFNVELLKCHQALFFLIFFFIASCLNIAGCCLFHILKPFHATALPSIFTTGINRGASVWF